MTFSPIQLVASATAGDAPRIYAELLEIMADPELPDELRGEIQGCLDTLQKRFPQDDG